MTRKHPLIFSAILIFSIALQMIPAALSSDPVVRAPGDDILAYMGSAATVDGVITPADGWDQTDASFLDAEVGRISVRAKHDGTNLYILFEVLDSDSYIQHIFFEDDGIVPGRVMDTVNEDHKYVGSALFPDGFRDACWNNSWIVEVGRDENGGANGMNSGANAVSEWWMPLSTGSIKDIDVSSNETLGFYATGVLINYDPTIWWEMHIIYAAAAADTQVPVADAGPEVSADTGEFAFFDGSGSTDNNGIAQYAWHFSVNGTEWVLFGSTALFLFPSPGAFTVTLNITDYAGNWDTDSVTATITGESVGPDTSEDTDYHYLFSGDMDLTETLLPGEYALIEVPSGVKDIDVSAAVITPQTFADFFVFTDSQLLTYLDANISYMSYEEAIRDVRVFEYSTNSTERLYIVIDNSDLSSGGAVGDTQLTFTITVTDSAPDTDAESLGEMFCWGLGGIFAFMAITTTYWLLSGPKKAAMGESMTKEGEK